MSEKLTRTQHQEPGTARRGEPGRRAVLAPAVRRPGRRLRAWWPAAPSAAGLLLRDRWGMEGVKPPPPVRLKDYSVTLPAEPAQHGRRPLQPGPRRGLTPPRRRS